MSLDPFKLTPIHKSNQSISASSKSISIFQTRQVIHDLQNSAALEKMHYDSTLLANNCQVTSGMIIDVNFFDQSSKIKQQLIAKDGEKDQKVIFSFLVLNQQDQQPIQIGYRWIKKIPQAFGKKQLIYVLQEEHLYRGEMMGKRKHGEGEYIITKKYSNATQSKIRYLGRWNGDIFCRGTIEDENGNTREYNNQLFTTTKSKMDTSSKLSRNLTIKTIANEMDKKKSNKSRAINPSCLSIVDRLNKQQKDNSIQTIIF